MCVSTILAQCVSVFACLLHLSTIMAVCIHGHVLLSAFVYVYVHACICEPLCTHTCMRIHDVYKLTCVMYIAPYILLTKSTASSSPGSYRMKTNRDQSTHAMLALRLLKRQALQPITHAEAPHLSQVTDTCHCPPWSSVGQSC